MAGMLCWRLQCRLFLILLTSASLLLMLLYGRQMQPFSYWSQSSGSMTNVYNATLCISNDNAILHCTWQSSMFSKRSHSTAFLSCNESKASIVRQEVPAGVISTVTFSHKDCLKRVIKDLCTQSSHRVPRVVHYVIFGDFNMTYVNFVSFLSTKKFIQPCLILIHGDAIPSGPYWLFLLSLVDNIVHVKYERPTQIFGKKIKKVEHSSDVARLRILNELGGIYMDNDQFVLRPLDNLFNESMVISTEIKNTNCGNGLLIAEPGARFLDHWLNNYTDFDDSQWNVHSTMRPYKISRHFPHLVRVVDSFFKPNYMQVRPFFNRTRVPTHDWPKQYGFHLYYRLVRKLVDGQRLDLQDNVVGDAVRYILYGNKNSCRHFAPCHRESFPDIA